MLLRTLIVSLAALFGATELASAGAAIGREAVSPMSRNTISQVNLSSFRDCADGCPEMIPLSPGNFQMGSVEGEQGQEKMLATMRKYSMPRHLVIIGYRFAMGKYDVTRAQFATFVHATGYRWTADCTGYATRSEFSYAPSGLDWHNPGFPQTDHDPVVCVNWDDVHAYLMWLSIKTRQHYRLPSEAEWEYSSRSGTSTQRYWGNGTAEACRYANVEDITYLSVKRIQLSAVDHFDCSDGYVYTSPVGTFLPNGFGLYDMLGNVEQLTEDCWNYDYFGAPSDGSAWLSGDCVPRVTRGGSFKSPPTVVRYSYRSSIPSFIRSDSVGFRVARNL
jgi:formylglycine-generating enzyme